MSPQKVELSAGTKGSIRHRMVKNALGLVHKSLRTTCPKITHGVLILAPRGSRGHSKDWTRILENGPSPSALRGTVARVGGGLASTFQLSLRLRQGPPSGIVLLMAADVVRLPHVTHAGLAARDPTCRPPLQGVVSPQHVELSAGTRGSIKQRMVQNAFGLVHKSLHTTCPKITHGVLIFAHGGSRGEQQRLDCNFGKRTLPIGSKGRRCTCMGWGLASAFKPRLNLRLRQAPPSGMVLLMVADFAELPLVTHAGLAARDPTCRPPLLSVVSRQKVELSASTKGSIKQRMVQKAFGLVHKSLHTTCPKITHGVLTLAHGGSRGEQQRLDYSFGKRTLPVGSKGCRCNRRGGGGLACDFKRRPRLQQGPPSGMVLLMVANIVRLPHVTHATLAARDPTCRPPLQGVVSPQNVELSASTKGFMKQRMVQNAFGLVHKSLHTTCPQITHGVLIMAPGGSSGAQQRLDCNFGKRTLPIGSKGRRCNRRAGPCLRFYAPP